MIARTIRMEANLRTLDGKRLSVVVFHILWCQYDDGWMDEGRLAERKMSTFAGECEIPIGEYLLSNLFVICTVASKTSNNSRAPEDVIVRALSDF